MTGLLLAVVGGYGVYLLYTSVAYGWKGVSVGPTRARTAERRRDLRDWMVQAGLDDVPLAEFAGVSAALAIVGGAIAWVLFGGPLPAIVAAGFAATFPAASYRARRERRRNEARDAWPRMIEEIRLLTGSLGRSIPQALLDVGRRGPAELRPAFAAAEREWLISTDVSRTCDVLK